MSAVRRCAPAGANLGSDSSCVRTFASRRLHCEDEVHRHRLRDRQSLPQQRVRGGDGQGGGRACERPRLPPDPPAVPVLRVQLPPRDRLVHGSRRAFVPGALAKPSTVLRGVDFVAAHNAPFDRSVLRACCRWYRLSMPTTPFRCTVQIARARWSLRPTTLRHVADFLGLELDHHHAASDAQACANIVLHASAAARRRRRAQSPAP